MKTLQNNFTTPEQSKRLLELGVPADSADCYIVDWYIGGKGYNVYGEVHVPFVQYERKLRKTVWKENVGRIPEPIQNGNLPCWSVGRLIEIFDMCYQREPEESITEHWILTQEATENFGSYIEYLVQTFCMQKKFLDFSKLED